MSKKMIAGALAGAALTLSFASAGIGAEYQITIRNATLGQPITPPIVIAHNGDFHLFELGQPASDPLTVLAETGSPMDLFKSVQQNDMVMVAAMQDEPGVTPPAMSTTITLNTDAKYIDFAAMLAMTNDAFIGVLGVELPQPGETLVLLPVTYDAGSEVNNERSAFVPGLGGMARAPAGAEGFVHVHRGINGSGDLELAIRDWRDPAIVLVITNGPMIN